MQSRRPLGLSSSATNRQEVCLKGKTKKQKKAKPLYLIWMVASHGLTWVELVQLWAI